MNLQLYSSTYSNSSSAGCALLQVQFLAPAPTHAKDAAATAIAAGSIGESATDVRLPQWPDHAQIQNADRDPTAAAATAVAATASAAAWQTEENPQMEMWRRQARDEEAAPSCFYLV